MSLVGLTMVVAFLAADGDTAVVHVVAVQAMKERSPGPKSSPGTHSSFAPNTRTSLAPTSRGGTRARRFGPGLESVKKAIAGLDYTRFSKLRSEERRAKFNRESRIAINDRYTIFVKPLSHDRAGRVRLNVRIEMAAKRKGEKPVNALSNTTIALVPGEKVNLGGLRLDKGDLIIVLWVGH